MDFFILKKKSFLDLNPKRIGRSYRPENWGDQVSNSNKLWRPREKLIKEHENGQKLFFTTDQ